MEVLSGFLLNLYRLAHACPTSDFQREALGMLAGQLAFDSARWASGDLLPNLHRRIHHCHLRNEPLELHTAYHEVMLLDRPMLDLLSDRSKALDVIAYQSAARFASRKSSAFREYQQRFAHENVLTAAFKRPSGAISHFRHVSVYRAREEHRFVDRDLAFMKLALPHLLEAQAINATLSEFGLKAVDDRAESPSNVADLGGFLLSDHASLRALLHAEWPGWSPPRLPAALWDGLCQGHGFRGQHVVATALRVEDLVIFRVRRRCAADGLSPRELQVARRIAAGDGHKQIALALGISPATARNHVQRIHGKLQARNAADVIAALAPLAAGADSINPCSGAESPRSRLPVACHAG